MRDMAGKCSSVVEMCVKAEKEMNQEVRRGPTILKNECLAILPVHCSL